MKGSMEDIRRNCVFPSHFALSIALVALATCAPQSAPGPWARIDWMRFSGMAPYPWGFCLTAYRAPSRDVARATPALDRSRPRTGCNGSPFWRMRPAP